MTIRAGQSNVWIGPNWRHVAGRNRSMTPTVGAACRLAIPTGDMTTLGRDARKCDFRGRPVINVSGVIDIRGSDVAIAARDGTAHLPPGYVRLMRTDSQ